MTDDELQEWWAACGTLVKELRTLGQGAVADQIVNAASGGSTSTEILGDISVVLRKNSKLRRQLSEGGVNAWKSVMADVNKAFSPSFLGYHWGWKKKKL